MLEEITELFGEGLIYLIWLLALLFMAKIFKMIIVKIKGLKIASKVRHQAEEMARTFIMQRTKSKIDAIMEIHDKTRLAIKTCRIIYEKIQFELGC